MNLKIGGSNVGKIMYNGQEFGSQKLESGTILYMSIESPNDSINDELDNQYATAEIIFPNVGKHWEGLKKIRIYHDELVDVFDVNSIDEPTQISYGGNLTIHRERSLTDEPDKLIATTGVNYPEAVMITVEEWN